MSPEDAPVTPRPIRVLVVDDSEVYLRSTLALLAEQPDLQVVGQAGTGAHGIDLGRELAPQVLVLDLSLPDMSGWEVAEALRRSHPGTGLVILSSHDTTQHRAAARALDAIFVHKADALDELVPAVRRQARAHPEGLDQHGGGPSASPPVNWTLAALQESETRFRATFEQAAVGMAHVSPDGRWLRVNRALCQILGRSREELLGLRFQDITHPDTLESDLESVQLLLDGKQQSFTKDKRYVRKDVALLWVRITVALVRTAAGAPSYFITVTQDITERVNAEFAQRELQRLLTESQAVARIGSWSLDLSSRRLSWSRETYRLNGVTPETFEHSLESFLALVHPDDRAPVLAWTAALEAGEKAGSLDFRTILPNGQVRHLRRQGVLQREGDRPVRLVGTTQDVTEQRSMEAQLRQAQKMEAVGQLAGGVAHDFNNLLTVILSYSEYARAALRAEDPLREDLDEIHKAGQRAVALTRQLLAFSRRQVLEPRVLDLNRLTADLHKMLQRLIGEDIALVQKLAPGLWPVKADPGQLEQVITNLVVNARDAMPQGGTLTVETTNVDLDQDYATLHLFMRPGPYVLLSVSDTGTGMNQATRQRLFEPFFTTKEPGKGTGLGLSTVYGIVKQSGGDILVYSEPQLGTTFKVYLPRFEGKSAPTATARPDDRLAVGDETILLVEDDEAVRKLTLRILRAAGFRVLAAGSGAEAFLSAEQHPGKLHLLLTDVVMPQLSGPQLAERLIAARPGLRVLFMSGYAGEAIIRHGVGADGGGFISKPFAAADLRRRVREVLDEAISH